MLLHTKYGPEHTSGCMLRGCVAAGYSLLTTYLNSAAPQGQCKVRQLACAWAKSDVRLEGCLLRSAGASSRVMLKAALVMHEVAIHCGHEVFVAPVRQLKSEAIRGL